jgi:hypothetical protein
LAFGLFNHFFFIIFDIDCDDDGLSIASIQRVENERESCEMIEEPFCIKREGPNWDLSQNWLAGNKPS